jgi:prophage regulatory protein
MYGQPLIPDQEPTNNPKEFFRILRLKEVINRVGLSRSTIYDYLNPKSPRHVIHFPRPFKIGNSAIGWFEHEIEAWQMLQAKNRF